MPDQAMSKQVGHSEVVIIGAGPAGLAAAVEAAKAGAKVHLVDRYPGIGGHYYCALSAIDPDPQSLEYRRGWEEWPGTLDVLENPRIKLLTGQEVWGIFPEQDGTGPKFRICMTDLASSSSIMTKSVILATGTYDRPLAFPGWTLPGVITAGAAQLMVKRQPVFPWQRVLLAGTGPLQLALAHELLQAGVEVMGVLELSRPSLSWFRLLALLLGQRERMAEAARYFRTLIRHRVPVHLGRAILRADGHSRLEKITVSSVNRQGLPIPGSEEQISVDAVCLGYGLLPSNECARQLGCDVVYDKAAGCYVVQRDAFMETGVPGVFVAGDGGEVHGKNAAILEGRIAAISAARHADRLTGAQAGDQCDDLRRRLDRERRFGRALTEEFGYRPGLFKLAQEHTQLCRCEEVQKQSVENAIASGVVTLNALRSDTRVGMGRCQGRYCELSVAHLLAQETEQEVAEVGCFTPRVPLFPVRAGNLIGDQ